MGLLRVRSATLLRAAGLTLLPATALAALPLGLALSQGVTTFDIGSLALPAGSDPGALHRERLAGTPFALAIGTVLVAPGVIAGMWAARRRLLEEPERNRAFLVRAVVLTTAVSVAGALPSILVQTGAWSAPSAAATWLASLLAADLMRRVGHRGPAENLLRRLTRRGTPRAPERTPSAP